MRKIIVLPMAEAERLVAAPERHYRLRRYVASGTPLMAVVRDWSISLPADRWHTVAASRREEN